jgi:hypothetical protein
MPATTSYEPLPVAYEPKLAQLVGQGSEVGLLSVVYVHDGFLGRGGGRGGDCGVGGKGGDGGGSGGCDGGGDGGGGDGG